MYMTVVPQRRCYLAMCGRVDDPYLMLPELPQAKESVCDTGRPSVRLSVTLRYRGCIAWTSSKISSLGPSLLGALTSVI